MCRGTHGGKKSPSDALELELWMAMSYHVEAGKQIRPLKEQQVLLTTWYLFNPLTFIFDDVSNLKEHWYSS